MIGVDETMEMQIARDLKPIISKKLYKEKAMEIQPDIHVNAGKFQHDFIKILS